MNTENETMQEQVAEAVQEPEQEQESPATISDEDILKALESPSEAVKAALDKLISEAVKKALAGATPRRQPVRTEPLTRDQFAKMTYKQRCELFNKNRPLYEKLKGEL